MSQAAMVPPEGVVADLQEPTDVLRTTNFITQALTLAFCSAFVFVRGLQKVRVSAFSWSVDDREPPPLGIDPSSTSFFGLKLTG